MSKASISKRISIAWHPDLPSEPTSTVVLSTPTGRFIDIRITLDPTHRTRFSSLELANAGTAIYGTDPDTGIRWGKWTHEIDSRPGFSDGEPGFETDSGWMETLDNGDVLEKGRMKDPTGILRDYEEIWRDKQSTTSDWRIIDSTSEGFSTSTTGKTIQDAIGEETFRTVTIRVDRYAQGILKLGPQGQASPNDAVVFHSEQDEAGAWKVIYSQGDSSIVQTLLSLIVD